MPRDYRESRSSRSKPPVGILPILAVVGVVAVLITTVAGIGRSVKRRPANQPAIEAPPQPVAFVTAPDLVREFETNEVAADAAYKNKVIQVSGRVDRVGRDIAGTPFVILKIEKQFAIFQVQCLFDRDNEASISELTPNTFVRINGTCQGKFGNVLLRKCTIN